MHHGAPSTGHACTGEPYDLETNPNELTNLWEDPTRREVRTELQERLLDVLVATEDRGQAREAFW